MASVKKETLQLISEAAENALAEYNGVLGTSAGLHWSERLTSSMGLAFRHKNLIKLSAPIIRRMAADKPLEYALEQVGELVAHELCHIFAHPYRGHGYRWVQAMNSLGYTGTRCHEEVCGRDLYSSTELRAKYPVGSWVDYLIDEVWYFGQVLKHNTKTITVSSDTGGNWRISWAQVEKIIS